MTFYTSLSGLKAAQTDLATISNNVANVGTLGFKKSRTEFGRPGHATEGHHPAVHPGRV